MNRDHFPVAKIISTKIVNLPTDIDDNRKVLDFIKTHIDMIESDF